MTGLMTTVTWLGHAGFMIESGGQRLVIDAWLSGPTYSGHDLSAADLVLVSHGHFDHAQDAPAICLASGATLVCIHEIQFWAQQQGVPESDIVSMNKGGTYVHGDWKLTMVDAVHSGGCPGDDGQIIDGGAAAGWIIECPDGEVIYHAGDTAVFGDMALIGEMYRPLLALLPIGGHYTMGPAGAAKALELLNIPHAVPMHYGTFPLLAGTPQELQELAPAHVSIHALHPGDTMDLAPLQRLVEV